MIITCPECKSRDDYGKYVSVRFGKDKYYQQFGALLKISKVVCTGCEKTIEWSERIHSFEVYESKAESETPTKDKVIHITRQEYSTDRALPPKDRLYNIVEYDSTIDRYSVVRRKKDEN